MSPPLMVPPSLMMLPCVLVSAIECVPSIRPELRMEPAWMPTSLPTMAAPDITAVFGERYSWGTSTCLPSTSAGTYQTISLESEACSIISLTI
ncbi:hypothetical protein [Commensalibacter melissae]|uniref:hypothetical protein n=1 Tax=Commensalibacter melissae TaxID=2070537 RepID=UPI0018C231EF|nr:hypothetical protein [Commensalibacter melissae]